MGGVIAPASHFLPAPGFDDQQQHQVLTISQHEEDPSQLLLEYTSHYEMKNVQIIN